ncbi:RagB/SusD family nutrient uptake outer membrane protein [Porphyromonas cangingivalis]|uniref:SusD family protein n=2 Tax=Porphyromonas cangingivalis TaxID=36874 RepID=A0A1T4L0T3_PORCN|nr:RagB/SusD family nutrient uptake outer membrane protein [Porphyromonas cangingivalis]SJZ48147.1 SusD family protein [Porphyromonas cangingivalis]VEJ03995.1 SusD family [Porphyromonas cangingivalis]
MKKITIIILSTLLFFSSCTKWLEVEPKSNVKEERIFKHEQGFKETLTAAYIKMSASNLYGKELTYGFIDMLAQRYVMSEDRPLFFLNRPDFYSFVSGTTQKDNYTNRFWHESYNIIANINNLIKNINTKGQVITTPGLKDIILGEALGLRAFLHFDLLRMFGPIYKDNPQSPSIPYRLTFDRQTRQLLPATEVLDLILADLVKAETLLKNDKMEINYALEGIPENPFLTRRSKRMNKYAVKALMARVYLYKGDIANAKEKAQEVINAKRNDGSKIFTFVTNNAKDHLLSNELIFALSMDDKVFPTTVLNEFLPSKFSHTTAGDRDRLHEIFDVEVDGINDIRMREIGGFTISAGYCVTQKYMQDNYSLALNNTMPLIRLAEMYYILAEASDDLKESARHLSKVRKARALETLETFDSPETKLLNIEKEYRKEFYAEGQLWFFYKRHGYKTFQFCPIQDMKEHNYRFTIPDDEITFGNIDK